MYFYNLMASTKAFAVCAHEIKLKWWSNSPVSAKIWGCEPFILEGQKVYVLRTNAPLLFGAAQTMIFRESITATETEKFNSDKLIKKKVSQRS